MELLDVLRTTGAIRQFTDEPVSDEAVWRILDNARFAPSGGNQQAWHVVVVRDPDQRQQLRDLYVDGWRDYQTLTAAGLRPWSPLNDRAAEAAALAQPTDQPAGDFAEHLDDAPVLLAVFVDLGPLAAVDRDHDRYTFAGGASIYPFVWNLLLAAREEHLGGVMTTVAIRNEDAVKALFDAPDHLALAAVVVLGHPVRQPRKLTRQTVDEFASVDRIGGQPFTQPTDR
ncbi:MAG: nitroreductase family protein [Acidimicrobiia bacterium]|nr:nitroreductase family protein [Acidimicrobiia bacterium]